MDFKHEAISPNLRREVTHSWGLHSWAEVPAEKLRLIPDPTDHYNFYLKPVDE